MKKFKKVINKLPKKSIAIVMILAIVLNYIIPLTKVFADTYTYKLTFTIHSGNQNQHTMVNENGILKIDGQYVELRDGNNQRIGIVACADGPVCTITVTDGPKATLNYNGNNSYSLYMKGHDVGYDFEFQANEDIAVQDYVAPQQNDNPGDNPNGGGNESTPTDAVVLWTCGNSICYHEFENIPPFDDGNSTFYRDTEIVADNKQETVITFDIDAEYKEWYLKSDFDAWVSDYELATGNPVDWDTLDPEIIMGKPKSEKEIKQFEEGAIASGCQKPADDAHWTEWKTFEGCVNHYAATQHQIWTRKLQPVGEPDEANAYVSYGDRNFKVVIYNSDYKGITIGDLTGLNYYPARWADPFLRTDQYDVSGTSANNPKVLSSILLESTVNIKTLPINNYEITDIEPLDVPENAVEIIEPDANHDYYRIVYSSNFYDHVVFKITDSQNKKSYIRIDRATIDASFGRVNDHPAIVADFYFSNDESLNLTHNSFVLTAKIIYKNGTKKTVTLNPVEFTMDDLGNPMSGYEINQEDPQHHMNGKGLIKSMYAFELENDEEKLIDDIYMNAEYTGSNSEIYKGAYTGSGEGTPANICRECGE